MDLLKLEEIRFFINPPLFGRSSAPPAYCTSSFRSVFRSRQKFFSATEFLSMPRSSSVSRGGRPRRCLHLIAYTRPPSRRVACVSDCAQWERSSCARRGQRVSRCAAKAAQMSSAAAAVPTTARWWSTIVTRSASSTPSPPSPSASVSARARTEGSMPVPSSSHRCSQYPRKLPCERSSSRRAKSDPFPTPPPTPCTPCKPAPPVPTAPPAPP
ncbi:hypothetical protein B484DRAFT_226117, partial [Ochromonadaceae sp. CCMP2298]